MSPDYRFDAETWDPPGLRPEYDGRYSAAYLLDPDDSNVEASTAAADRPPLAAVA